MEEIVVLTGFMGVGKTASGRALAKLLGWAFVDLDDEIERSAGKPIPRIFAEDGEGQFRAIETRELSRVLRGSRVVVATGGGVLLSEENRQEMAGRMVVNLDATPEECVARLRESSVERPLLSGPDPESAARRIYDARKALYGMVARQVSTEGKTSEAVAEEILSRFLGRNRREQGRG